MLMLAILHKNFGRICLEKLLTLICNTKWLIFITLTKVKIYY